MAVSGVKLRRYRVLGLFFLVLFLSSEILSFPVHSWNGDKHKKLWYLCLGIEKNSLSQVSQKRVEKCFNKFSTAIDNVSDIRLKLSRKFKVTCEHRLLMHWGFNLNDPKRHDLFRNRIEAQVSSEEERENIFDFVKQKWKDRNNYLISVTQETFGLVRNRSKPLATIIYDIHILADYTDKRINSLANLDFLVEKDLIRHGLNKLFRGTKQQENERKIAGEIAKIVKDDQYVHTSALRIMYPNDVKQICNINSTKLGDLLLKGRQAFKILIILKRNLPELLGKSFGKTLDEKGIRITYTESLSEEAHDYLRKIF